MTMQPIRFWPTTLAAAVFALASGPALSQLDTPSGAKVVVDGVVPDEATRAAIIGQARAVYGADRVVDQLGVGPLVAPPNWGREVQKVITPELLRITNGQLKITGNVLELEGQVGDEAQRQRVASAMTQRLGSSGYTVRNGLRLAASEQLALDTALAKRSIAFEPGNARLTGAGMQVLDELLPVLQQFRGRHFEVVGHTDADGPRERNLALSEARARSVKEYLVGKGVPAATVSTAGAGPDRPVADNATPAGRARNRRIEFRVLA